MFGITFSRLIAAACVVGSLSGLAAAQTVSDLGATTIYYDGAQISGTLTSPDPVIISLTYGPVSGSQTATPFGGPYGPGTNIPVLLNLSQLAPNTAYSYQWIIFDQSTSLTTTGPSGTFTTGALPTGGANPFVPPANPPTNGIYDNCGSDAECLADINGVRAAQENLQPITLPSNWASLTGAEQIFVFTNLERESRGIAPIPNLVNTYDAQVETGIATDADPVLPADVQSGSIWSGFGSVLGAFLGWLYYDGPGGSNLDCTSPAAAACWGHRDNVLNPAFNEMDAGAGTDNGGAPGEAALFWVDPSTPPAANVVLTWASEEPFLS